MSNPRIIKTDAEFKGYLIYKALERFALHVEAIKSKSHQFKSGGIVAGEAHQGEAVVSHKGLNFTLTSPPNFAKFAKGGTIKPTLQISESDLLKLKNLKK